MRKMSFILTFSVEMRKILAGSEFRKENRVVAHQKCRRNRGEDRRERGQLY